MLDRQGPSRADYSRLDQQVEEDEDDTIHHDDILHSHPNSVLVANHHGQCNIVPLLSTTLQLTTKSSHSPRTSFSVPDATRRFFSTKLPIAFRKDMGSTASFSSLPPVIIADFQNGNLPDWNDSEEPNVGDQGWVIVHRRRFKGKHGIGETRHPLVEDMDEEIDPSDQVTCSVFVKWTNDIPSTPYTMSTQNYDKEQVEERHFEDPIPETEERYNDIIQSVRTAIESNMQPTRISQGSSGSYFCRNSSGKIVGVFKPKNEEPYGQLNPKWTKWIHRHLFPCFFGRSCLIPNLGYLSEAAASLIDRRLGTMIVPYTDVIHLSSPSFHYDYLDRKRAQQHGLPPKIGSFQCFLTNYKDATVFFRDHPFNASTENANHAHTTSVWGGCLGGQAVAEEEGLDEEGLDEDSDHTHVSSASSPHQYPPRSSPTSPQEPQFRWTPQLQSQFKCEFEQLIILDYLIRNTDRGLDNWMIKYCPSVKQCTSSSSSSSSSTDEQEIPLPNNKQSTMKKGHIHVAAIDNGLAFPYKHPDQWRSYPYGWMAMPDNLVNRPFSNATRQQFLSVLSDPIWWRDTVRAMRSLFEMDDDFDEKMFQKQMAVLKGQGYNIVRTLSDPHAGPVDLVAMQRVVINQEEILIEYDEKTLASRDMHAQQQDDTTDTADLTDAFPARRLRSQRSTSFDVISTLSHFDEEEEIDQRVLQLKNLQKQQRQQRRWQDKIKNGLDRGLFGNGQKKKKTSKKNRYRAFDSDGDISDDSFDSEHVPIEEVKKRVTIVIETIQVVKSRTYFTCW